MSLDPPKVLLDRSFLAVVLDALQPAHEACVAQYRGLLEEFEREEVLLVAVSTHLRDLERGPHPTGAQRLAWFLHRPHRGVFAPVDPLYVGFQHRRAANAIRDLHPADALTLVMCERNKVRRIATPLDTFDGHHIERLAPVTG